MKRRGSSGAKAGPAAVNPPCGCAASGGGAATDGAGAPARDGVGPGAHALGVDPGLKEANLKQLRRIEGQVRGIAAMIEDDRYCADIITQVSAVRESLHSVARNLMRNHIRHCAAAALHDDGRERDAMIEELLELVGKIAR